MMRLLKLFAIAPLAASIHIAANAAEVDAWEKTVDIIPEFVDLSGAAYTDGDATSVITNMPNAHTAYSLPPGITSFPKKPAGAAGANFGYSIGCDGVNISNVVNSKIDQFTDSMSAFAKSAPAMAVMWIAYSDPTLKAVMDGLDIAANFGLEFSNMNCNAGKKLAQSKNFYDWAEAASITECENDDGLCHGEDWSSKLVKTKRDITSKIGTYSQSMTNTARNTALYSTASSGVDSTQKFINDKQEKLSKIGINLSSEQIAAKATATAACEDISKLDEKSTLRLVLSRTELSCDDISYVVQLLPDYKITDSLQLVPVSHASLEVSEWYEAIHKDLVDMLKPMQDAGKDDFQNVFNTAISSFSLRTGIYFTQNEVTVLQDYFNPKNRNTQPLSVQDAFLADLAHETSIMMMTSSLKRFKRNFSRTSLNLESPDQKSPFDNLRAPYMDRINYCVNEIKDIDETFKDSQRIKNLINSRVIR